MEKNNGTSIKRTAYKWQAPKRCIGVSQSGPQVQQAAHIFTGAWRKQKRGPAVIPEEWIGKHCTTCVMSVLTLSQGDLRSQSYLSTACVVTHSCSPAGRSVSESVRSWPASYLPHTSSSPVHLILCQLCGFSSNMLCYTYWI